MYSKGAPGGWLVRPEAAKKRNLYHCGVYCTSIQNTALSHSPGGTTSHMIVFVTRFGGGRNWLEERCNHIFYNLAISFHNSVSIFISNHFLDRAAHRTVTVVGHRHIRPYFLVFELLTVQVPYHKLRFGR